MSPKACYRDIAFKFDLLDEHGNVYLIVEVEREM